MDRWVEWGCGGLICKGTIARIAQTDRQTDKRLKEAKKEVGTDGREESVELSGSGVVKCRHSRDKKEETEAK